MGGHVSSDTSAVPTISWLLISPAAQQVLTRIFGILTLFLAIHIIYNTFFHPISKVPGPIVARYTSLWLTRHYFAGTWLEDVVQLHEKYGPVVRIAPNEVSFVDEGALRELYGHGKLSQKTRWYGKCDYMYELM